MFSYTLPPNEEASMAHIYRIVRLGTDQCYVGHTSLPPQKRWWGHQSLLKRGKHHAPYLQNVWNKEGHDAFAFEIVEECLEEDKVVREQYYMDTLNSCFNCAPSAGSKLGYKLTDEQLARCSAAQTGLKRPSSAACAAIARESSPANKPGWIPTHRIGMKDTPEVVERRRQSLIVALADNPTIWITDGKENRRLPASDPMPDGWEAGRTLSEEHAEAIRSVGPRSEEARANIKAGHSTTWDDPGKRERMLAGRRPFGWWTDGITSKRVPLDEAPPVGWRSGRAIDAQKLVASRDPDKERKARNPDLEPSVIAARLAAGESIREVALSLGVALSSVHRAANKGGRKSRAALREDQPDEELDDDTLRPLLL
jgi:hypothetical protein